MKNRWIFAGAAALAVALFAVPMLLGRGGSGREEPLAAGDGAAKSCPAKAEGKARLDFTLKDMNGTNVRLTDYKGKVILMNFWATWCGPCKTEIPAFNQLYEQYKDQGLVVLGVSTDDEPEALRAYAASMKMTYPVLVGRDKEELLDAWGPIYAIPTSFYVGRDGSICGKHMGPATKEEFEREIKALLQYDPLTMLKGFTHARLACGCRIGFREGVEGSPVTVIVEEKGPGCPLTLHVRDLPLFDYREALRPSTRLLPPVEEDYEES